MTMASNTTTPIHDLEHAPSYSTPLLAQPEPAGPPPVQRRLIKVLSGILISLLFVSSFIALTLNQQGPQATSHGDPQKSLSSTSKSPETLKSSSTGVPANTSLLFADPDVDWQRTAYHYQTEKHFIGDPNGPLVHMGWYHLFYQYNPVSAIWGNITWGHAVSRDTINWFHLPVAMAPSRWYDVKGVLTGSATILPDGQIIMLYTGNAYDLSQLQCLATPANVSDPLLLDWVKYPGNPILFPPPGIGLKDFRDPSTMWIGPDGKWRMAMGTKYGTTGVTLMYKTTNFTTFELLDEVLHSVPNTGMWECIDFYPVSTVHTNGLDTSFSDPSIKHVIKESSDDNRRDWYSIGTYDPINEKWTPDDPTLDLGIGLKYDHGKFYASKTFYDPIKRRRLLWGYVGETDTHEADLSKGWATLLNVPRTVVYDMKTRTHLLLWPVEEVESLRSSKSQDFKEVELRPGSVIPLDVGTATQLDISATFEVDEEVLEATVEADVGYNCSTSSGSAGRGVLGPFGLLVLADESLSEQTPIYFYIAKDTDGSAKTHFCADDTRSSKASYIQTLGKMIYGGTVPVLQGEKMSVRLLVDHSIVESFAQGGRSVITSRVYPTRAIYGAAKLFLFNNATGISVKASLKIWHMGSAKIKPFQF